MRPGGLGGPPQYNGVVALWDTATGRERTNWVAANEEILALEFSPDGKTLAYGGHDENAVILYDLAKGQVREKLLGHSNWVWSVAFSPDGRMLATASGEAGIGRAGGEVILWDMPEGRRRATLSRGLAWVAFSPDGRHLASCTSAGTVAVWDPHTGQLVSELVSHLTLGLLKFTRDGKTLVGSCDRGSVEIWNLNPALERASLIQSGHFVAALALSPDGRLMATGGDAGEVFLWPTAPQP